MRKFINIINEALRPSPTKTSTDELSSLIDLAGDTQTNTVAAPNPSSSINSLNTVSGAHTRTALSRATMPNMPHGNILRDLQNIQGTDEISDEQARRNAGVEINAPAIAPLTADNLPMVIRQEMMAHGDKKTEMTFDPEWHQVKHLPGYMMNAIRQIGRQVFRQFTNTPIEDVQIMCDILNPNTDVMKMAAWIVKNGVEQSESTIDFSETLPGYAAMAGPADCTLWNAVGYQFLIMRDGGGHYIYGWPEDNGRVADMDARAHQINAPHRRLR